MASAHCGTFDETGSSAKALGFPGTVTGGPGAICGFLYRALQRVAHFERHPLAEARLFRLGDFRRVRHPAGALGKGGSPIRQQRRPGAGDSTVKLCLGERVGDTGAP
jgi:hypothetical protein